MNKMCPPLYPAIKKRKGTSSYQHFIIHILNAILYPFYKKVNICTVQFFSQISEQLSEIMKWFDKNIHQHYNYCVNKYMKKANLLKNSDAKPRV